MDRDIKILIVFISIGFAVNMFLYYNIGMTVFPVITPDFCGDSVSPVWCGHLFGFIQLAGLILIVYFVFAKKYHERVRG